MNTNIKFLTERFFACAATLLLAATAHATPETLDWDTLTWVPAGNTNLSETYTTGSGDITVTFSGNTAGLEQNGADIAPMINQLNTGGLVPAQNALYVGTDYADNSNPMVIVTIDFTGYPGGVGNFNIDIFDMDSGTEFIDEMTVTAVTPTGIINPTSIATGSANTQTNANTVRGTVGAGSTSANANVSWTFGDAGTPVSGISQVNIIWRNQIGTANPGLQWINIHDFTFDDPMADVELTKSVTPTSAGAGEPVVFTLDVVNNGPDTAPGVEVTDLLPNGFSYLSDNGGTSYNSGSGVWTVGDLASSGTAQLMITAQMEAVGPWDNITEVTQQLATDPDSTPGNNVPAEDDQDNAAVTLLVPEIGTAKRVIATPTNNGNGSYTLTYEILVRNTGDLPLNNLQVVDDMAATFAGTTAVVVDSVTSADFSVNPGYDGNGNNNVLTGTDTLATGATGIVSIAVTVATGGNLGTFQNTATSSGATAGGVGVNDDSQTGANPDPDGDGNPGNNSTPTAISFTENPQIGLAKAVTAGPTNNGDGTYTLSYTFTLENMGDASLSSVQAVDNLANAFSGATGFVVDSLTSADFTVNAGFTGNGNNNLLDGTDGLAFGATGTLVLTVTVTPGGTLGPYNNTSFANGTSPAGSLTIDNSVDGLDPDPDGNGDPVDNVSPTPVTFGENPEIGTAKTVSSGPTNNGDGTHTLTYTVTVNNSGDVALNNIQVVDNLATTFAGATGFVVDSVSSADFAVNGGYNGAADSNLLAGTDTLAAAAGGTVDITVTVTPGGSLGPYNNAATSSGSSPAGTGVSDVSTTGSNPDPDGDGDPTNNATPTPVTFGENPEIGAAKLISSGPTNNGDGTHTLTYTVTVNNSGDVALNNVQVVDNLATTFAGATGFVVDSVTSADFAVNAGYNGAADTNVLAGTDTLAIAATGTVDITVTVTPGGSLGPYNNSATANGSSPAGTGVSDVSTTGSNPDPDGDGNPGNNTTPTPVTFGENPQIGTAKAITSGPTNNGDGTHTLSYTFTLENFGDVVLNNVQAVDNLATTFSAATGFVVDSITSTDFSVNAGYDGNGNNNLLAGTDSLAVAANGTLVVSVTVTPGGNLGPYDNSAFAQGTSPAGSLTLDNSVAGLDPDPDGNGDPVDNVGPTPVTFGENPEIGTAKLISSGPTNNGDGTHTLTYTVTVNNSGDVALNNVQVVDDLATTFAAATGFVVDSVSSADFAVNAGYNGAADTNVLAGTDTLAIGASGTVDFTVTVTPGGSLGPYNNSATASGGSPAGTGVSDVSTAGSNPDPDGDGNPGNNTTPTPVTFGENPEIGAAKLISSGPTSNGDGTHTLTYTVTVNNSGDVALNNVQVVDNLATTFASASGFVVDSVTSADFAVNAGYNGAADTNVLAGTDTLAIGASGTVDIAVTVTPGGSLGPYNNSATANGMSPAGTGVSDVSTTGSNPDPDGDGDPTNNAIPTPVTFGENPEIGTAKSVSAPTNNGDGTHTLTYTVTVANSGDVALNNVQVVDNLAATFAAATGFVVDSVSSADFAVNAGYNGTADTNILAGTDTLAIGASGTVDIIVTVTPGGLLGPYNNSATANGSSPAGTGVSDVSNTGVNPDPDGDGDPTNNSAPTPITFGENPEIGTAKSVSAATNNGDGTHTLTYTVTVANSGDVALNNVQVVDNLATTFAAATGFVVDSVSSADFAVNAGYNGAADTNVLAGTDTLAIGASGTVDFTVTVTPGGSLGPYNNSATASGSSPAGTGVSDVSTAGSNPDPDGDGDPTNNATPTPVTFGENPEIGTAKSVSAATNNGDGTHTLTYTVTVNNSGDVALNNVQVVDNLATTFAGATAFVVDSVTSADFAVNAGYNGAADTNVLAATDTLAIAATGTVDITVTVTPGGSLGPYNNSATANGMSPAGTGVSDVSTAGSNPDPDGDGNPGNNTTPTPVTFGENPEIGTAKLISSGPASNGDGTHTLTYTVTVVNSGDVALNNVQVVDNLATTFAGATGFVVDSVTSADFAVNAGYNGAGDTNVLAGTDTLAIGATGTVDVTVTVTPGGSLGPYNNNATATGSSPAGTGVSDVSNTGVNPDPDGDGDPGNNSAPTPVTFGESPEIGTAKSVNAPTNNGDGTFTLTYNVIVTNSGDVALNNVQVVDNLATTFAGATGFVVDSVTSADFSVNGAYNGVADTNLLAGTDTLAIGTSGAIAIQVTVTPGGSLGPYNNSATADGTSPAGTGVSDVSTAGADPDPDGDGNPGNNSTPTPVSFAESPQIGLSKAITSGPTNNGDGSHTLSYTFTLENFGDVLLNSVQAVDNLATTFAGATGFAVDSISSGDFTVNAGYDGNGNNNLLAGTDSLAVATTGTVILTVTVTPGGDLGPYNNSAFAEGTSPGGSVTLDNSVAGLDPDPDGNNDPTDNVGPTPVTFSENPEIGTAKLISSGPTNNGDGTHTLTYTVTVNNSGDVPLSSVQVVDNLATTFAAAMNFVVDSVASTDFAINASFNGTTNTNVLVGTDTLAIGATGTVDITVTVEPGATLGPYDNNATANGNSPAGTGVSDDSTLGSNPDPDGDGNPGNNTTPTPVSFGENPQIGIAKGITSGPTNNGDGTHTLSYTFTLENFGDVVLNNVQATDNLATTFSGATGFVVDSINSADFTVNAGFNGNGNNGLLAGTDSLTVATTGTVTLTVTVTPGGDLGPYDNSAFAQGFSPAGALTLDNSVAGLDPDPDGNGDPVDNVGPTPVTFGENPQIGIAKGITSGPTNNGDGTHTLSYTFTLENFGDVVLNNVQAVDNLASTFSGATGFVVDSISSADFTVNAGFDGNGNNNLLAGTDSLAVATTGALSVTITVTPGGNLGPYDNTAFAQGFSPAGALTLDNSVAGLDPDPDGNGDPVDNVGPTPVTFGESPEIGTAKSISAPINNGDGTHTLTYTVTVNNSGDVALNNVQVVDNLATTFASASGFVVDSANSADFAVNPGYNGAADTNVLVGTDTLAIGATGTVDFTVTVTPGGSLGPYNNNATANGTSPAGTGVNDVSNAGVNPDPDGDGDPGNNSAPTPVTFGESPEIGTAKSVNAPTNNGDGTHTLTYNVIVANSGDVALNNVQVVDNLATTFAAATGFVVDSVSSADFAVNGGYNGAADTNLLAGTDTLAIGASGAIAIQVTVTPGGSLGPYNNSATANGTSPAGTGVSDVSTVGANPDPDGDGDPGNNTTPTTVTFGENPQIGLSKAITSGPTSNGDGTHTLSYTFTLENFGDVVLNNVQAVDNLATTFSGATGFTVDAISSGDFTVNAGFDGNGNNNLLAGTDSLAVATTGTFIVTVTVTPGGNLGPYDNSAFAQGTSPGGSLTLDNSVAGLDPDPDGNDDPVDNVGPTPVTFGENPQIGTAKTISNGPVNNGDGTYTLTYNVTVENSGEVALSSVQVVDDLTATFAGATGFVVDSVTSADFTVNGGYNGAADTNLLVGTDTLATGASGTIAFVVTVTTGGSLGPYNNNAVANGTSPAGTGVSDTSTDGTNPDPDGDGDPGNNSDPTTLVIKLGPIIGIAKTISSGPTSNGDGTFTLTYTMTVVNSGDEALNNAQVVTDLATGFAAATGFVVDSVSSADFAVNGSYDGNADTNLLAGTDIMAIGATGTIDVTITVTPGGVLGPYDCIAIALGTSPAGTGVSDTSTDGTNPDPDGDGDPSNNSVPTTVSFGENPEIGIAKTISSGPTSNGDGTFTLTYTMTVANSGDVALNNAQVVTDLATGFAAATGFVVDSVTSADFAVNGSYDGNADTNLLAGTDTMAIGATGTIDVTITVTPGGFLGPYDCIAVASGTSPAGTGVNDVSTVGVNPDPDGDGDPGNNSDPTTVNFGENPEIGIAKTISSGPINNGDGTFTLTYTMMVANSGDVALSNAQVVTDLATGFAAATGFVVDSVTSADFAVNGSYDGNADTNLLAGTDTLAIGGTGTIDVTITVTPGGFLGPYDCIAIALGTSPAGTGVSDTSTDGTNPDPDGDGDPSNNSDPTTVSFGENPEIGIAKTISSDPINNGDGTFTLTYTMTVANSGDVALDNAQVVTDLATAFAAAGGFVVDSVMSADFTVNAGYDGNADTDLLAGTDTMAAGTTGTIDVTFTVSPGGAFGPYDCIAIATGTSPAGTAVSDTSTDGTNPDPDGDGDPGNNSEPTSVSFMIEAAISGNAWLDENIDDLFDAGEMPLTGWIIEVLQNGVVVATVPVNPDGSFNVTGLPPGSDYSIQLRHPSSNAVFGTLDNITLPPGLTIIDQNLPIDPSGVVYDSNTRLPVPGVTVTMVDSNGTPLPASCLLPDQQDQVTDADGYYRFDLLLGADPACMSGDSFDIVFTTPSGYVPGVSTNIPPTPGPLNATGLPDPFQVQPQFGAPMGSDSTLYYLSVMLTTGDPNIINNHIPIDPVAPGANVLISKRADRRQTVVGDLIIYTISIRNPGAAISGLTVSDLIPAGFMYVPGSERLTPAGSVTVSGQRPVLFSGISVAAASTTELRYMLRVGAGVVQGDYTNSATPLIGGIAVGNTATATVTVTADPDFEQTSVIGSVFNDANGNGWQDDGEFGIPGVRLATVEGLLIETDAFGRYHIAGVDGGRRDRGRNFIIKVDPNTLPDGVEFTTENPRVQRITEGLLNRFDFGVNMPASAAACCEQIDVKIGEVFFEDGSSAIRPEFLPLMQQLADRLTEHQGGTLYIEGHAEPAEAMAYTPAAYTVTQHFGPRSIVLSEDDKRELDAIIEQWRGVENLSVSAVGHTCNTRIAPKNRKEFKNNYELSVARAQAVAAYVRLGLGIAPEQVTVIGKGADDPVASNATPEGGALNRRVELSINGQRIERAVNASDLARDRANSIYNALRKLLGDDMIRNINISSGNTTEPVNEKQEPEMTSGTQSGNWLTQGAGALLGLLVSTAHADTMPAACTVDACMTDKGYAIQILPSSNEPSPNDTRAALADDKRVDINGKFFVPVSQGGQLWATEDPTAADPRLAVHAPSVSPLMNGRLAMPVSFFVYANYPAFIERAEIQIYHGDDIDHITPLAVVPFKPGIYSRVDWDGQDLSRQLSANDELFYRVRAYDKKGRYDETHLDQLRLLSMEAYERSVESDPTLLMPSAFGKQKTTNLSRGPLDGNVLVLQTPTETQQKSRVSYSLTPHFDSRKTELKTQDRAEIDSIIAEWRGVEDLSLHVIGHTDNVRIAPQNRKEFANNQVLSQERARAVANYVAGQLGVRPSQVIAEGRADKEPIASNATASGRAKNRRVDLMINGTRLVTTTTSSAKTTLVEPHSNTAVDIARSLNEALYDIGKLNSDSTSSLTGRVYADPAPAQSSAHALEAVYGKNNLRVQRIPVNGSRVRINGHHLGNSVGMRINGDPVPLDASGKYVVEYVMPVGSHNFDVEMIDDRGNVTERQRMPVSVSGQQIFMVALADFTLSDNNISGSIEPTSGDNRYDDDMLVEGRLAFYLKGKIKGKYLITAQMDSQEEELSDLFSNLFDKDPKSVFRRLDPDRYYPVYGDDSTTINDTDTQGRFYVRADWDKSRALWGNFHTGLTGNEFAQYNRSLYGAQYQHQSLAITEKGEAKSQGVAFVSEAQTAFGHSEFLGTGGSLYYLRHQDILPGSEKAWIEVRDRDSNRVREVRTLTRGIDYEVDEIQGRIILARPLMLVSGLHAPGLIKDTPLDGNDLVLLVDYEYLPIGFGADRVTAGGSGKYWLSDDIAIGATYVDENRRGENYGLFGGDFLWKPGQGTYLKAEFAQSEATQSDRYFSADGGLTFDSALLSQATPGREGDAWGVEARVNSREAFNTEEEWVGGAWYRRTDDNFSVARRDTGVDTTEYGVELTGSVSLRLDLSVRASVVERELLSEEKRLSLQADYSLTDYSELSGEVRSVDEQILSNSATGLLLALRYSHKLNEGVEVYGIGQATLDNDSGRYDNNDLATLGVRVNLNDRTSVEGEYSTGHRGNGALLNLDYRLDDRHEVYGTFTQSADRTDLLEPDSKIALGHRSRVSDQTTVFNERQFVEDRGHAGIAHVFGLDMALESGWAFGLSVQQGDLETDLGRVDRDAATVTANYRSERLNYRGKVEYRDESGVSNVSQKLTTNRLDLKLSEDWRLLTRINHAETEDDSLTDRDDSAVFTEAGIGFAYRPVANSRLNLLAKYTFLYDLPATFQVNGGTDQRSNIISLEGIYQVSTKWEIGGKLAQRSGELRTDRDLGQWFESTTNFAALRARYHLIRRWDALLELRRLDVDEAQSTRTGWLLGVDRHINDNFRLGVGYNFTDFSDDLSNLDYDHDGWFINALGKY